MPISQPRPGPASPSVERMALLAEALARNAVSKEEKLVGQIFQHAMSRQGVSEADRALTAWLLENGASFPKLQWPVSSGAAWGVASVLFVSVQAEIQLPAHFGAGTSASSPRARMQM